MQAPFIDRAGIVCRGMQDPARDSSVSARPALITRRPGCNADAPMDADQRVAREVSCYIRAHVFDHPERLEVHKLARHFAVCQTRLRKLFKWYVGQSIRQYIIQFRHRSICDLLANTNMPIKDIAVQAGYAGLSNFSRDFSKMAGVSPTNYRLQKNCAIRIAKNGFSSIRFFRR